jgi:hypothetical protein
MVLVNGAQESNVIFVSAAAFTFGPNSVIKGVFSSTSHIIFGPDCTFTGHAFAQTYIDKGGVGSTFNLPAPRRNSTSNETPTPSPSQAPTRAPNGAVSSSSPPMLRPAKYLAQTQTSNNTAVYVLVVFSSLAVFFSCLYVILVRPCKKATRGVGNKHTRHRNRNEGKYRLIDPSKTRVAGGRATTRQSQARRMLANNHRYLNEECVRVVTTKELTHGLSLSEEEFSN